METLNDDAKAMLRQPIYGWVTTLRQDGSAHSTVVWLDVDGEDITFNTAVGRAKERHIQRDPRVTVSVLDPNDGYHLLSVSGTAKTTTEGADEQVDALAKKYLGVDSYPFRRPDEQRIIVRVSPEKVIYSPGGR
jgi:PPOX class probable F420-dependent enzyme